MYLLGKSQQFLGWTAEKREQNYDSLVNFFLSLS